MTWTSEVVGPIKLLQCYVVWETNAATKHTIIDHKVVIVSGLTVLILANGNQYETENHSGK